jgi:hypothetical protein
MTAERSAAGCLDLKSKRALFEEGLSKGKNAVLLVFVSGGMYDL